MQALLQKAINMNAPNKMQILVDVNDKTSIGMYLSLGFAKISGTNCIYATYINKDI